MELVPRGGSSNFQSATNEIQNQSNALKFILNEDKYKEMQIQFNKRNTNQLLQPATINGKQAELVFESKVLRLIIRSDLVIFVTVETC